MKNRNPLFALSAIFILATGCAASTGGHDKPAPPEPNSGDCKEILGDDGTKWLQNGIDDLSAKDFSGNTLKEARKFFYAQDPSNARDARAANLCEIKRFPPGENQQSFNLKFTASWSPFDDDLTKRLRNESNAAVTPVNPEVLLFQSNQGGEKPPKYGIFVKCQILSDSLDKSGGGAMPLEGTLEDSATGDKSPRTHMKHLLHATKVMTNTLSCRNNPSIPDEPPASVK